VSPEKFAGGFWGVVLLGRPKDVVERNESQVDERLDVMLCSILSLLVDWQGEGAQGLLILGFLGEKSKVAEV